MHVLIAALHRPIKPTGVCRHAVNLALCLAQKPEITKISLVIGSWQQHYFETAFSLDSDKIKLVIVNLKNSSLTRNIWFMVGLPKLANQLKADVVHLSFPFPIIKSKFNAKIVSTIHDLYPYECPENFGFPQVWFNRLFLKQCINHSDGLACVSQVTADKLKFYFPRLNPQTEVKVIYNYVDFQQVPPQIPSQFTDNSSFLLTVAQHRQNKNLDVLIEAYSKLLKAGKLAPETKMAIVGTSGPETEKIHSLIDSLGLESKVLLLSSLSDAQLSWLYQNCLAFVIPSSTEGFCLPLAEALQLSDRIICSDIPIFREVGNSNCTYFSLKDNAIANLAQAIIQSINQPKLSKSDRVNYFQKSVIADKYLKLYQLVGFHSSTQPTN